MELNKKQIAKFCKKNHIASLALFGSILTNQFNDLSDIDLLVKFQTNHLPTIFGLISMEEELTCILGRKVDLKTANELSPYFRKEVLKKAKVIYES